METRIESSAGEPRTVDEARQAVEQSRQRISTTLDALEGRIVEKKHALQDRVDVLRPVREQVRLRPFAAVAVAAGVGALLGSLGGGDDDDRHSHSRSGRIRGEELSDDDRRELREWRRARRDRLRTRLRSRADHDDHDRDCDDGDSRFDALKHQLLGALTSAVTTAVTQRVRRLAMDNVGSLVDSVVGGSDDDRQEARSEARATERGAYR